MLLSRGSQYTLRALIHLARQPASRRRMVRDIAEELDIPPFYLAKLMQPVARVGWLETLRGRGGGVRLARGYVREGLMPWFETHLITMDAALAAKLAQTNPPG